MSQLRWLSNTYDPEREDADRYVRRAFDQTQEQAVAEHRRWLEGKVIGAPKATKTYTEAQLRAMGMVGVYVPEE